MLLTLIAVVAAVGLMGCDGGDDGDDAALIGTWQPYMATMDGTQVSPKEAFGLEGDDAAMTAQFAAGGALTIRYYDDEGDETDTEDGTWTADNGTGTLSVGPDDIEMNYAFDGRVMVITFEEDGATFVIRWVPVADLPDNAAELARTWQVTQVQVNGAVADMADYFDLPPTGEAVAMHLLPAGILNIFILDADNEIIGHQLATWATQGELLVVDPEDAPPMRGVWADNNTSVTLLDPSGDTLKLELAPWAPEGERDPALVGQWRAQSVTVNGAPVDLATFFEWAAETDHMQLGLSADGTASLREFTDADHVVAGWLGTWSTAGDVLTLGIDGTTAAEYDRTGITLTLDFTEGGDEITLEWILLAF